MKKILSLLLCLSLLFSLSCKRKAAHSAQDDQVMVWANFAEPQSLDPALGTEMAGNYVMSQIYEGLTDFNPKTAEPVPGLAERWDISPDGKTYTFYLRSNAKWSDGQAITAQDFVASWQRLLKPETASDYAYMAYYIKNAEAINQGKLAPETLAAMALDAHTLKVELNNPTPFFLSIVAFTALRPVPMHVVSKFGEKWTRAENFVGNGYFKLTEWVPQKHIIMVPNEYYWDRASVKLDKVIFLPLEDRETALKKALAGEAHYVRDIPSIKVPSFRDNPNFHMAPNLGTYYVMLNTTHKPLDNVNVRKALWLAIDRKKLMQTVNQGEYNVSLTPKGIFDYQPPQGEDFNPAKAREYLAKAGYTDPKTFPKLVLTYNTDNNHKMNMEIVQSMWRENLGINVELQNLEWKVLIENRHAMNYEIARSGWYGDYLDPNTFLDLMVTNGGNNNTGWGNARYDELIRLAGATTNNAERWKFFAEAEQLLLDEAPIIPLYTYTFPSFISTRLQGFYPNLLDMHPLKSVSLKTGL